MTRTLNNPLKKQYVYYIQLLIGVLILLASPDFYAESFRDGTLLIKTAQFIVYMLTIKGTEELITVIYNTTQLRTNVDYKKLLRENKLYLLIFTTSVAVLLYVGERVLSSNEFLFLLLAISICKYPEMNSSETMQSQNSCSITYGVGMACSFVEGYLGMMIPGDDSRYGGLHANIGIYESSNHVRFPVKRLFIIITKTLFCPSDMKKLNKDNRPDLPYLEACKLEKDIPVCSQSLENMERNVAGVINRIYRNSAYMIRRPNRPPVYIVAEFATPLHTLYKVLQKSVYGDLMKANKDVIKEEFCTMLHHILESSPETRGKCELVQFDDSPGSNENLADVILDRIRQIEPDFENLLRYDN